MRSLRAPEPAAPADPATVDDRLSLGTVIAYSSPVFGAGFMSFLAVLYLFKFATDVLLVAPAVIGAILAAARIWDAIADPAAGYWSDRSRARFGRRRAWVLASAIPLLVFFPMTWAPPAGLEGLALAAWLAIGVFGFFTAETILLIPHAAWGAELSTSYHDRTRIFGVRSLVSLAGSLAALAGLYLLTTSSNPRSAAVGVAVAIAVVTTACIAWAVLRVRERPDLQGRGPRNPLAAYRDVARNPHARLLLVVFAIENLGAATLGVLVPYVMHYIIGKPELTAPILLVYFLTAIALTPTWIPLARRFGKKRLWVFSMALTAAGFGGLFFVREGDLWVLAVCGLLAGTGGSCGQVVGPSIQADIIDWDEHQTGERKEGVYFAAWNFVRKVGMGVIAALTGATLTLVGFVPNQTQSQETLLAIRILFALFPGATYVIGALLFLRFRFNEREHAEVRADLERRRAQALEAT